VVYPEGESEALRLYRKAVQYAAADPEVCLGLARKTAEAVLLEIARRERLTAKPTFESLLQALTAPGLLPGRITVALRTIQGYGNYGSHAHEGFVDEMSAEDVTPCVKALTQLLTWHGDLTDQQRDQFRDVLAEAARSGRTVRVADSTLIVVKAVLLGWQMERVMARRHYRATYVPMRWSDDVVRAVAVGQVQIALYNERRIQHMLDSVPGTAEDVAVIGRFGHSMGGRNFYLLAADTGPWSAVPAQRFLANPSGARIAVPRDSDMFGNLLTVLGTDEAGLDRLGVQILDVPHHLGLEIFQLNPEVLVVGGQNLRLQARLAGGFVELINTDMLDFELQGRLWNAAANTMIANRRWLDSFGMDPQDLYDDLIRNFLWYWSDERRFDDRLQELIMGVATPPGIPPDSGRLLVKHILFETYRFGAPC